MYNPCCSSAHTYSLPGAGSCKYAPSSSMPCVQPPLTACDTESKELIAAGAHNTFLRVTGNSSSSSPVNVTGRSPTPPADKPPLSLAVQIRWFLVEKLVKLARLPLKICCVQPESSTKLTIVGSTWAPTSAVEVWAELAVSPKFGKTLLQSDWLLTF